MNNEELKDYIANADLDVYIVRKDYISIRDAVEYELEEQGRFTDVQIRTVVDQLAGDPYFTRLAKIIA